MVSIGCESLVNTGSQFEGLLPIQSRLLQLIDTAREVQLRAKCRLGD